MRIKIATVGEPVLRDVARPLRADEIGSDSIRGLIAHMRKTLADAPGVGLAAPQVGEPLQLAIVEDTAEYQTTLTPAELAERERHPVPFHILINLEIELLSSPDVSFFEGCLSLPGFLAMVPRARKVRVHALNEAGEPVQIEAEGWYAGILQHEIDHLRGTLYIDRIWSSSFSSLDHYNRHRKPKATAELLHKFHLVRYRK
jgi:peptide deformylase